MLTLDARSVRTSIPTRTDLRIMTEMINFHLCRIFAGVVLESSSMGRNSVDATIFLPLHHGVVASFTAVSADVTSRFIHYVPSGSAFGRPDSNLLAHLEDLRQDERVTGEQREPLGGDVADVGRVVITVGEPPRARDRLVPHPEARVLLDRRVVVVGVDVRPLLAGRRARRDALGQSLV